MYKTMAYLGVLYEVDHNGFGFVLILWIWPWGLQLLVVDDTVDLHGFRIINKVNWRKFVGQIPVPACGQHTPGV